MKIVISGNDNMNMKELRAKLILCVMHEKKKSVVEACGRKDNQYY
jgi:hypothetical protein